MSDCPFHPQLDAYYDGELSPDAAKALQAHLPACGDCTAALAEMRSLSAGICVAAGPAAIEPVESRRLHAAIDRAEDQSYASIPLLRTAGLLSALAASILIVAGVWLLEMRGGGGSGRGGPAFPGAGSQQMAASAEWERVALTLHADPRPNIVPESPDSPFSPSHFAVGWMIEGLTLTDATPWEKPGSF